jgi:hypothetical protein
MANVPKNEATGEAAVTVDAVEPVEATVPNEVAAPCATHDQDLQARLDGVVMELDFIEQALTRAGFEVAVDADGRTFTATVDRLNIVLALLASSREASEAMTMIKEILAAHGMQVEGEAPFETVIKMIGAHKSLTEDLVQARQAAEDAEAARQKAADDLAKKPRAVKGAPLKKLRNCGPFPTNDGEAAPRFDAAGLLAHIGEAETVELAFSDGTHELADAAPLIISGAAWKVSSDRLFLTGVDVPMHGASREGSPFTLAGYGLFVDGTLAAYAPRINGPLQVAPGTQHSLNDDVVFG